MHTDICTKIFIATLLVIFFLKTGTTIQTSLNKKMIFKNYLENLTMYNGILCRH